MCLHKAGTPTSNISSLSVDEKWAAFPERDSKKMCLSEHCQRGRGKSPQRIWTTSCSCIFVVWIYTSSIAPKSCCRESSGFGLVMPSWLSKAQASPPWRTSSLVQVGSDGTNASWKILSDLTDSEHEAMKQLCALRIDGIYWPTTADELCSVSFPLRRSWSVSLLDLRHRAKQSLAPSQPLCLRRPCDLAPAKSLALLAWPSLSGHTLLTLCANFLQLLPVLRTHWALTRVILSAPPSFLSFVG